MFTDRPLFDDFEEWSKYKHRAFFGQIKELILNFVVFCGCGTYIINVNMVWICMVNWPRFIS